MWPYRGDTQRLSLDGEQWFIQRMHKYGPVFSTWILGRRSIIVGSLDTVKWCLTKEHGLLEGVSHQCVAAPGTFVIEASGMGLYTTWLRLMACSKA